MFLLMLVAMTVMYMSGTTEDTVMSRYIRMTTYQNLTIASGLKKLSSNLTYRTTNKLKYRETSPLNFIKYVESEETNATVDLGGTRNTTLSLEYPGMPDPCASPRRNTGVEDILCMVCFYTLVYARVNGPGVLSVICQKKLRALRGFFAPPPPSMKLNIKIVFHQFVLISLLEQ